MVNVSRIYKSLMKKMYGRFNGKLFPLVAVPGSYIALLYLLLIKKNDQVVILPTSALGDAIYVFSFLENLYKRSNKDNVQLLIYISDRYKQIAESYALPINKIVYLKHLGIKHLFLLMLSASTYGPKSVEIARNRSIIATIPQAHINWLNRQKIFGTRNRLARLLNVPLVPISYHNLPRVEVGSIPNFGQIKNKVCVINSFSYSMEASASLYEIICNKLLERDFIVYTNVVGNQKEIKGSKPLACSIDELYSIACDIPLVVSVRSGILDFLIPSKVNMFVIYEKTKKIGKIDSIVKKNYSLEEWLPKGNVCEVCMENESDEDKIINEFDEYLNKLNLDL